MPNKWTFTIKPIKELLKEECEGKDWIDPFAGENSPAEITNDINPDRPAKFHKDALEFLSGWPSNSVSGALYDPPYSYRQVKECYAGWGKDQYDGAKLTRADYWASCRTELARIVRPGGKVICFGWNSGGLGKNRGFELTRILLVPHGGGKNDTIVTVEKKL